MILLYRIRLTEELIKCNKKIDCYIAAGKVGCIFSHLFIYSIICWDSRVTALLLRCHSVKPCSSKGGGARAIFLLWRSL